MLKKQLIKHGYDVQVANNGQEALDLLTDSTQTVQIDCILMDVEMPIMDGLTAARKIREWERRSGSASNDIDGSIRPRPKLSRARGSSCNSSKSNWSTSNTEDGNTFYSRLPIIAISANARPEQTNDAIVAGMDDTIAKPFRIADLIPRIDHLLDRRSCPART